MKQPATAGQNRQAFLITAPGAALRISLAYAAFGGLWILFSDQTMSLFFADSEILVRVSMYKGWFFVAVTSGLLFLMVLGSTRRYLKQQEQMRNLLDNIPDLVWLKDVDGVYLSCNPSFERFFGAKESEIVGRTDYDFVPRELADFFRQKDQEAIDADEPRKNEEWITLAADGRRILLETIKRPLRDHCGNVVGVLGIGRDITTLHKAQDALLQSETMMKSIFRVSPIGIGLVSNRILLEVNDYLCQITGYAREELIGKNARVLYPSDDDYEWVGREKYKQIRDHGTGTVETRFKSKNGEILDILLSSTPLNTADLPAGVTFTALDITERKRMEGVLKESEGKYRSMMEAMEDAAYICSPEFRIEYQNLAMTKKVGRDVTGELCYEGIHGIDVKCPWCFHERVMQGEVIKSEVVSPIDSKTYHISYSPIYHADGSVSTLSIFRDITETKKMAERLDQAQRMEAIGALAGGIAHDFNNILFPIMSLSEMLLEDLPAKTPIRENVKGIHKAAKRARDLVKQILSFSRQSDHQKMPVNFQQILKEVMKLSRATIPSNIKIHSDIQYDCGLIMSDPTQLHQIAMNLITNAYHAVEEAGGEISVRLKETELPSDDLAPRSLPSGKYAVLTVSDTGHGIAPSVMNRIFEPYFTTKEHGKGTGLGLSVVYGILKEHGGDIRVYSETGKGAAFTVYLPVMEKTTESTMPDVAAVYETGTERILLVDDEEAIARLETQLLERLGYRVTARTSSADALEAFEANPSAFDLVLTDMTMPNMTGTQLAAKLFSIRPDIPIVICTGFSEKTSEEKAKANGINGFLMKPVVKSEMAKMVRKVLDEAI
ncbi:MAG: PAS domain S-box protein [Pseudomonadota bacterium]